MASARSALARPENSSTGMNNLKVITPRVLPPSAGITPRAPKSQPSRMRPKTGIRALSTTIKISQTARNPGSGKADKLSTRGSGWQFPSQRLLSGFHCGQGTPMNAVIDFLNNIFWSYILVYGLLAVGAFFTLRLGFIQFRHFGEMVRAIIGARQSDKHGISPFQALCTSLASRIGTGNIAGVAVALYLGGPGAIFWMWVVALVGMATG